MIKVRDIILYRRIITPQNHVCFIISYLKSRKYFKTKTRSVENNIEDRQDNKIDYCTNILLSSYMLTWP